MRIEGYSFGSIRIDGETYEYDMVIDRGEVSKRKKKVSKAFRGEFGHTPLSAAENIPWECERLVVGTGEHGALPVMDELKREAKRRKIELVLLSTIKAVELLNSNPADTNAILHLTC